MTDFIMRQLEGQPMLILVLMAVIAWLAWQNKRREDVIEEQRKTSLRAVECLAKNEQALQHVANTMREVARRMELLERLLPRSTGGE